MPAQRGSPPKSARRWAWFLLGLAAVGYLVGFLLYPPRVIINSDEEKYVAQALAFAQGRAKLPAGTPFSREEVEELPSLYPPGTSILQTPFVWLGGWRGAAWASVASLLAATFLLAIWLRGEGLSPLFALIFMGYLPTLVLGRVAISDVPSAAIVTAGLLAFWRGQAGRWPLWFYAGLFAGLSLLFREANALLFAPFFLGALLRRERKAPALFLGGALGLAVRLLAARELFGSYLFVKPPGIQWSLSAIWVNAPLYAFALLVLIPGGLLMAALYRGRRRPELIAAAFLVALFYLSYGFSGVESGALKRLILGPRFFIPLAPLLAFATAEVVTRMWSHRLEAMSSRGQEQARRWVGGFSTACCLLVVLASIAVHPLMDRSGRGQAEIVRAIYTATPTGAALVANTAAAGKFISVAYGDRVLVGLASLPPEKLAEVLSAHPETYLVVVDRSDSEFFRSDMRSSADYLASAQARCRLLPRHSAQEDPVERLRIWKVEGCASPVAGP